MRIPDGMVGGNQSRNRNAIFPEMFVGVFRDHMVSKGMTLSPRSSRAAVAALLVWFFAAVSAVAADTAARAFDLPADNAERSLKLFSEQTNLEVLFATRVAKDVRTNPVKGDMTPRAALDAMLANTGLVVFQDGKTGALTVRRENPDESKNVNRAIAESSARPGEKSEVGRTEDGAVKLDTFQVFAGKSLNMDIQRTRDDVQPYVVFDADTIERSQAVDLQDFLNSRLPMNTMMGSNQTAAASTQGAMSTVTLRGLSKSETLILIDGRRTLGVAMGGSTGDFEQFDLNGIPLSAIERIEVLPSTAGGIYGGGATGGVINIIKKRNYSGFEARLAYGNTFDTDTATRRVDLTGGFSVAEGKTEVALSYSFADNNVLESGDRDFVTQARAHLMATNPSEFSRSVGPPEGYLPNIHNSFAFANANLVLKNGTVLNAPFTFIPAGYGGVATDGGAALAANAGNYSLAAPNDSNGQKGMLWTGTERESASFDIRQKVGKNIQIFAEASKQRNESENIYNFGTKAFLLPVTAPNNPFTTPVVVNFPRIDPGNYPMKFKSESARAAAGVIVQLPKEWKVEADYTWNNSKFFSSLTNSDYGDPDGAGPMPDYNTALTNGTLDVMKDINLFPLNYAPYLPPHPNNISGPGETILTDTNLRFSGPVAQLPAGALTVSGAAEYRKAKGETSYINIVSTGGTTSIINFGPSQEVVSYYAETLLPLFSATHSAPLVRSLEFQASARRDEYETSSPVPQYAVSASPTDPLPSLVYSTNKTSANKFTAGLKYAPVQDVTFRASYGTGFLPPNIAQIVTSPEYPTGDFLVDPKRGGTPQVALFNFRGGGNPNLKPEESTSISVGTIFEPRTLPGFRLSVDYTKIKKVDEIRSLPDFQTALNLEDLLPGTVERNALTSADTAAGYTGGTIRLIDLSPLNMAKTKVEAIDIQADYTMKTSVLGDLNVYAVATWQPKLVRQILPTSIPVNIVDFADGPLEWKGNVGFTLRRGNWTIGWNAQYYQSYFGYYSTSAPGDIAKFTVNQGATRIPSQIYHDLILSYRVRSNISRFLKSSVVSVGIQNVFDHEPPILASTSPMGNSVYSRYGDPRLRRYTVSLKQEF